MSNTPSADFATFRAAYDAGRGQILWTRSIADLETPVAAYLKLGDGKPNSFLLESVEGGAARGRYSIIGLDPDLIWRCRDGVAELNRDARAAPFAYVPDPRPPLDSLRALIAESRMELPDGLPPMCGGLVGYLGYDMVRQMENLPAKNQDQIGVPEAIMGRPSLFAVFDNVNDLLTLAAPVYPRPQVTALQAWEAAQDRLAAAEAAIAAWLARSAVGASVGEGEVAALPDWPGMGAIAAAAAHPARHGAIMLAWRAAADAFAAERRVGG